MTIEEISVGKIAETGQYLAFMLGEDTYAVDIMQVREVLDYTQITQVPRMPEFMRGVINLRGGVVPVVDLGFKFGMSATKKSVNTCIIIMENTIDGETTLIGALADSVKEVLDLVPDQIEPAPKIGTRLKTGFIKGMGKKNDAFIILLDIEMPRMDGFELLENIRSSKKWGKIPVIMISSRSGAKHRQHANTLGADGFIGKPWEAKQLASDIERCLDKETSEISA